MKYTGVQCPACGETFDDASDVVVCSECGTPHHRTCYEKNNACINAANHSEDFVWKNPNAPKVEEKPQAPKVSVTTDPTQFKENMPKNGVIGEMSVDNMGNGQPVYREINGTEKIGDFTVDDYASVVQKNIPKYMPRFLLFDKLQKKVSWNWAAFFFGPFWLAYRKMYKYAALSMLLIFLIPIICISESFEYYTKAYEVYSAALTAEAYASTEEMEYAMDEVEEQLPAEPQSLVVSSYIEMGVDVILALFGNYLYMKHCTEVLQKANKKKDPAKYIKSKGGRSIGSVALFAIGVYVAFFVVTLVYSFVGTDLATVLRKFIK